MKEQLELLEASALRLLEAYERAQAEIDLLRQQLAEVRGKNEALEAAAADTRERVSRVAQRLSSGLTQD